MTDPILDEDEIIARLNMPAGYDSSSHHQAGAVQALIDLHDRGCTREHFLELAAPCVALYGQVAKLWMLRSIRDTFNSGELSADTFESALAALTSVIDKQKATVISVVEKLKLCPTSADKIH